MGRGYFIYKIVEGSAVVYIGRTMNLHSRLTSSHHVLTEEHSVEVAEVATESDMMLVEVYLINRYKPIYNVSDKGLDNLSYRIREPTFLPYKTRATQQQISRKIHEELWEKYNDVVYHHLIYIQEKGGSLPNYQLSKCINFVFDEVSQKPILDKELWVEEAEHFLKLFHNGV